MPRGAVTVRPARRRSAHGVTQTNLVSDQPGKAQITDSNPVNAWGLSHGPNSPLWVSNAGTQTSTKLWGPMAGDADAGGPDAIWFSAGPDNETHGLLGLLTAK